MAAHQLTGILDTIHRCEYMPAGDLADMIRPAVNLSCWTEQNFRAWEAMHEYIQVIDSTDPVSQGSTRTAARETLRDTLIRLLPAVIEEWQSLGEPRTLEEWHRVKYG